MAPDPSDTDQSGPDDAPLLPSPVSHPHADSPHRPSPNADEVWSTWALRRVPRKGQINWYLQLAIFMIACVLVWAAWPPWRRFDARADEVERVVSLPLCDAEVDAVWPTDIGFAGPTSTGTEAQAAATAYPNYNDISPLHPPHSLWEQSDPVDPSPIAGPHKEERFNLLHKFGNLSPWRSVTHGVAADAQIPDGCEVEQVQLLHRHGARYPTSNSIPAQFGKKLAATKNLRATGSLSFLNEFKYRLGSDILTPFGRDQLFSLGASFRVKYGHLLSKHHPSKPVFRTESQDRMHKSSLNFAAGFFGIPYDDQYNQLITVEWANFNNTLAPKTCLNAHAKEFAVEGHKKREQWAEIYLDTALRRLQPQLAGLKLETNDVLSMQALCAYEMVALGGSAFCELFTEEEWEGFEHYTAIDFWYRFGFGHPAQAAMGLGWAQEWLARTTNTPLKQFNSTTNSTLHTEQYFPLAVNQSLFVDATHDTVITAVIVALGFESFAADGPPPSTHLPDHPVFVTSKIAPFGANLHSQVVNCPSSRGERKRWVRWILNDGVVPLTHEKVCNSGVWLEKLGFCELEPYVGMLTHKIGKIDWAHDCLGKYSAGREPIVDGRPPRV